MVNTWLKVYNALQFVGWATFFIAAANHGFAVEGWVLWLLNLVQLAALLEIAHAALGWVRSPVMATLPQVASRVLVLMLINFIDRGQLIHLANIDGIQLCAFAWGFTETVRYGYFSLLLTARVPRWLTWLRYSTFIVLYPTGVTGEVLVMLS